MPGRAYPRVLPPAAPPPAEAPPPGPARYDNTHFFGDHLRASTVPAVPEDVFFLGRPRPPTGMPLATRTSLTPLRFALVLFLVGWAGILFQASFLQQVVFGAPVFEEMAKVGLALLPVVLLRIRGMWLRVPFGLASGAGFGIFEHHTTYSEEETWLYAGRVVFHAASAGLSMAFYDAFEHAGDVRTRWATTVVPTLFHWMNNFGAVVFAFGTVFVPFLDAVGLTWAALVTASMVLLLLVALLVPGAFRARARDALQQAMPRLGIDADSDSAGNVKPDLAPRPGP